MNNVYSAVIMAEPLRECSRFVWWIQNGANCSMYCAVF